MHVQMMLLRVMENRETDCFLRIPCSPPCDTEVVWNVGGMLFGSKPALYPVFFTLSLLLCAMHQIGESFHSPHPLIECMYFFFV